jgi:predicted transglutaminase-like cysteine proteinase
LACLLPFQASCAQVTELVLQLNTSRLASVPKGYVSFCLRNPEKCRTDAPRLVELDSMRWAQLTSVNFLYNSSITPVPDMEQYGVRERWDVATRYGDCEDFVLAKKSHLAAIGWPKSSLLIAVVDIPNAPVLERRHAVLLVMTDQGYYVLDNRSQKVEPWHRAQYKWISVQSAKNPFVWHRVDRVERVASVR